MGPTERGLPGHGLLAQVIVSKFADHIPCYRQVRMFRRQGVDLALSTVVGWFRPAMEFLEPIVAAMRKDILAAPIIQTGDKVVRLIDPGFGRCRQARLWGYFANRQVVYEFTPNRREERLLRGVALGRKNYLHFASEGGGAAGAVAYSLIESCKLSGVEPWPYIKDVLMRVWTLPADRIAELMPRNWRPPPEPPNTL